MGGIVKSIGRAVSKFGKSASKFLKKYRTTILLAAALWVGLGAFGVSHAAAGTSMWSPKAVAAGVARIFSPSVASGLPVSPGATDYLNKDWLSYMENPSKFSNSMAGSSSVLSGLKKWFGDMPSWGKYALTQAGMTIVGSMLDTSAEEELAAKYGGMGIPYGKATEANRYLPEGYGVPYNPTFDQFGMGGRAPAAQTSTPQQASLTRAPGVMGRQRQQEIAAMRTMPLDVRPPGMISGRSQGLIPMGAQQRRYA